MKNDWASPRLRELLSKIDKMTAEAATIWLKTQKPQNEQEKHENTLAETAIVEKLFKEYCDVFEMSENDSHLWHTAITFYRYGKKAGNGEK